MIRLNLLPCNTCVYYKKIMQKNHSEENEYVYCEKIKGNANELLYVNKNKIKCEEYKEDNDINGDDKRNSDKKRQV